MIKNITAKMSKFFLHHHSSIIKDGGSFQGLEKNKKKRLHSLEDAVFCKICV